MVDADAELLAALKEGRSTPQATLEALYWRHAERVWRYARYFSGDSEVASEIVQESFLRVARNLPAFEGRSKFSTWLYTVVRSAAVDITARRRRHASMQSAAEPGEPDPMSSIPANDQGPDQIAAGEETKAAVRAAVGRLPENEREAVVLCELQELSLREAGEVLGWSETRVKVTLFRGRRRLRTLLKHYVEAGSAT